MTHPDPAAPPTFETTPLEGGGFRFVGSVVLDRPIGAVWAKAHNIESFVAIVLPGLASNFQWVDGGSPGVVPARFSFEANGATLLEEVYYRSNEDHVLKYQLVTPALGMESYLATVDLTSEGPQSTRVTYTREMRFADPSLLASFSGLLQLEMTNLQAYFAKTDA
jgi:hypothetical protein